MGIPIGQTHSVCLSGEVIKNVVCEVCEHHYAYPVRRQGVGAAFNPLWIDGEGADAKSIERAQDNLVKELERAVEIAPCPKCGSYQRNMFALVRKGYHKPLAWLAALLAISGFGCVIAAAIKTNLFDRQAVPSWCLWGTGIGVGSALVVAFFRLVLNQLSNPNDEPLDDRMQRVIHLEPAANASSLADQDI